jgi:sugar lactone lactonase YvrE
MTACPLGVALLLLAGAEDLVIETIAGTGREGRVEAAGESLAFDMSQPFGVELGPDGALHVCEVGHHRLLRIDLEKREVKVEAGNGSRGKGGDGGPAAQASLDEPYEVRFAPNRDMYFVEMKGAVVRRLEAGSGRIRRVAGTGEEGYSGDGGLAVDARLRSPHSIALDGTRSLYIADIGNHRVRKVDLDSGKIETIAGNGKAELPRDGAPAAGSPLRGPRALAVGNGFLWIALREGNSIWKMDLSDGKLRHVAGGGAAGFRDGPRGEALFDGPKGIALGGGGLFVADTENHAIRRVDLASGAVTTVAGGAQGFGGDGGPALRAKLARPHGIAVGPDGVLYVGDTENHRDRRIKARESSKSK